MTTPPRTPTTAVEDLHAYFWLCLNDENAVPSDETLDSLILAIEAEARAEAEMEYADCWQEGDRLRARLALMEAVVEAAPGVLREADRNTDAFNALRAALAAIEGSQAMTEPTEFTHTEGQMTGEGPYHATPTPLDEAWEALAADIHAHGYSVRDAIARHRPLIEAEAVAPYQAVVEAARVVNEHYMDGHPYLACHTGDHMPALAAALAAIEGSTE